MNIFFQFEADFIQSLRCIPLIVRLKLDTCGVKLKLNHWHQLEKEERENLVKKPCGTTEEAQKYRHYLQELILLKTGAYAKELEIDPNPLWTQKDKIPLQVKEKAQEFDLKLTLQQWQNLTDIQRFALVKLSRPSHENNNFLPALKEFDLL